MCVCLSILSVFNFSQQYQCIISSMETSLMMSYLPHIVNFVWWGRVLGGVFLITQHYRLARRLSLNPFIGRRQRTESAVSMKKVTYLLCHQDKVQTQRKRIWTSFVAQESQLMIEIILHHRASLNRKISRKGTQKKVVRCKDQRALYDLAKQKIFKIVSLVFGTTQKRRCQI